MLSDSEQFLIRDSWRLVVPIADTAADLFYRRLFELRPDLRDLFSDDLSSQKKQLVALLTAGPLAAGYRTDLWTCGRVAEVVRKKFRVSYHPDHLGRILHDLGFTPQKPLRVAREQDAAAVERWRKKDWPRIKKRLAATVQASFLSTNPAFACSQ